MTNTSLSPDLFQQVLHAQQNELTEQAIYLKLSRVIRDAKNKEILKKIAMDEAGHAEFWHKITSKKVLPRKFEIFWYTFLGRTLGITFALKLMEKGEDFAQESYKEIIKSIPDAENILQDEERHEGELINMIEEEKLNYVGAIVLGLNDALVELTGALAGLSFALQNTKIIAFTGLITGIAASMSMAASSYLSNKADGKENAIKSSVYTGIAYIITVLLLVLPYFVLANYMHALIGTLCITLIIIAAFNYYLAIAKDLKFWKRFWEMAGLSMGVSVTTFLIGIVVRVYFGVTI